MYVARQTGKRRGGVVICVRGSPTSQESAAPNSRSLELRFTELLFRRFAGTGCLMKTRVFSRPLILRFKGPPLVTGLSVLTASFRSFAPNT